MINDPIFEKFLMSISDAVKRKAIKTSIIVYLNWRNIPIEDIVELGNKEIDHFHEFMDNTPKLHYKRTSKKIITSRVRNLLIFAGSTIKKSEQKKTPLRYLGDPIMDDYLVMTGKTAETKRSANRYLARYCDFRGKTPTELVEETKEITKAKLQVHLKKFYDSMTHKSKYVILQKIIRFYAICAEIYNINLDVKKSRKTSLLTGKKQIIDKLFIREMLSVADLRDSMLIMICFESGMNPVDIVSITYGDLKEILDLENPAPITDVYVMIHTRQKTDEEFLACFGIQSLNLIKKWLLHIRSVFATLDIELTDDFPIATQKTTPFQKLGESAISSRLSRIAVLAGLPSMRSSDFRNSFNTRIKPYLKHFDKELFMGHLGGIERNYDISTIDYYTEEYHKVWKICFDLSFDDVKTKQLERKVIDIELDNQELKRKVEKQDQILSIFYEYTMDKIGKDGVKKALDEMFPEKS